MEYVMVDFICICFLDMSVLVGFDPGNFCLRCELAKPCAISWDIYRAHKCWRRFIWVYYKNLLESNLLKTLDGICDKSTPPNHPLIDGIGTCNWCDKKGHQKYYLNAYIDLRYWLSEIVKNYFLVFSDFCILSHVNTKNPKRPNHQSANMV